VAIHSVKDGSGAPAGGDAWPRQTVVHVQCRAEAHRVDDEATCGAALAG